MAKSLWEIVIPKRSNDGTEFTHEHHEVWERFVRDLSGGLMVQRTAKGEWVSPEQHLFIDEVIPVRILCTREDIDRIVDFTLKHYRQKSVLAYEISSNVILRERKPSDI